MSTRPENVGILAMEFYVPKRCLPQTALEEQDGCAGKYTSGLGQNSLGFFDDREDVGSILLTALARLLERYGVAAADVGRLEVGTETLVDKSKSVKTALLAQLFGENADVEGRHVDERVLRRHRRALQLGRVGRVVGVGRAGTPSSSAATSRCTRRVRRGRRAAAAPSRCSSAPTRRSRSPARG